MSAKLEPGTKEYHRWHARKQYAEKKARMQADPEYDAAEKRVNGECQKRARAAKGGGGKEKIPMREMG